MLDASRREGAAALADVTRRALKRILAAGPGPLPLRLYDDAERQDLAAAFAAVNGTASLLGRSRIRLLQQRYSSKRFSERTLHVFDDRTDPLRPLAPDKALEFFRKKVALPGVTAKDLTGEQNRAAFTLAVDTDAVVLGRVKAAIQSVIETGREVSATPRIIGEILESAGIEQTVGGQKTGGAYADMVFRTNAMTSYQEGAQQELAEVADDFPVWRYVGIADGRQGDDHAPHFDRYFPSTARFEDVRGPRVFNCRCDFIPIHHTEWAELQKAGAKVEAGWQ